MINLGLLLIGGFWGGCVPHNMLFLFFTSFGPPRIERTIPCPALCRRTNSSQLARARQRLTATSMTLQNRMTGTHASSPSINVRHIVRRPGTRWRRSRWLAFPSMMLGRETLHPVGMARTSRVFALPKNGPTISDGWIVACGAQTGIARRCIQLHTHTNSQRRNGTQHTTTRRRMQTHTRARSLAQHNSNNSTTRAEQHAQRPAKTQSQARVDDRSPVRFRGKGSAPEPSAPAVSLPAGTWCHTNVITHTHIKMKACACMG